MKNTLIKIFEKIFGTRKNIPFKLSLSSLVTSIIFLALEFVSQKNYNKSNDFFLYSSAFFFVIWLISAKGIDSAENLIIELARLLFFFIIFIFSLDFCISLYNYQGITFYTLGILSALGLFFCSIYFISKLSDIFDFMKNLFRQIKIKLFNSDQPATTKAQAFIENITTFLTSIGGLAIAIKTIIECISQKLNF